MRVIDVGAMIAWLVWFFRHREEPDDGDGWDRWDERGGGDDGDPSPPAPRGPGGRALDLPLRDAEPWPVRLRDHRDRRPVSAPARRGAPAREPVRTPAGAGQQAPGFSAQKLS